MRTSRPDDTIWVATAFQPIHEVDKQYKPLRRGSTMEADIASLLRHDDCSDEELFEVLSIDNDDDDDGGQCY